MDHISYSVFGTGDRAFEHFCGAAVKFDNLLQDAGAMNMLNKVYKSTTGSYEDDLTAWTCDLLIFLQSNAFIEKSAGTKLI